VQAITPIAFHPIRIITNPNQSIATKRQEYKEQFKEACFRISRAIARLERISFLTFPLQEQGFQSPFPEVGGGVFLCLGFGFGSRKVLKT
jgi:hypothetical protein